MKIVDQDKLHLLELLGHFNSFNKKLIGTNVGAKNVEVMLGIAEVGGGSEIHYPPESEHILYVIEGVYNPSSSRTIYLVFNSPPTYACS